LLRPVFILLSFQSLLWTQAAVNTPPPLTGQKITQIEILGNEKTKPHIILKDLESAVGRPATEFDIAAARNALLKLGIFREVTIEYAPQGDGVTMRVTVIEKWTLIPMPVVSTARGINTFGLFLLDTNVLGYGKTLYAGALGSNRGWEILSGYADRSLMGSNFRSSVTYRGGQRSFENGATVATINQRYKDSFHTLNVHVGHEFKPGFILGLSGKIETHHKQDDPESYNDAAISSADVFVPGIYLQIEDFVVKNYYQDGWSGIINMGPNFVNSQTESLRLTARLKYTRGAFSDHSTGLTVRGAFAKNPTIAEDRLGAQQNSRTLPLALISADSHLSGTIHYEIPFLNLSWGTFTTHQFFEFGFYDNERVAALQAFYGPGAGVRMYLNNIAIPALGVDVSYAMQSRDVLVSAAFGLAL
jgi:Surface antigen variable number repeat